MNEIKMENVKVTGTLCGTVIEGRPLGELTGDESAVLSAAGGQSRACSRVTAQARVELPHRRR
jgi:hypothetical protein